MGDNPVLGTWRLLYWENRDATGRVGYPLGPDALGYLAYTAEGLMFAQIMARGRAPLATRNPFGGGDDAVGAAAKAHLSYCGTYEFDGARVVHRVLVSSFPNWVGGEQLRIFRLEGERLILSAPPFATRRGELTSHLVWTRLARAGS